MIEIKNFSKIYNNEKKAVDDISLKVGDGEIFAFIGHNGAGKSTTIKSIVGILDFDCGNILINGKSIKDDAINAKKEIAYVPDNPDLYENMKAIEYINFICDVDLCDIDMVIRIDEETYDCENCALVDTISRNIGCPLIIKENLKGVE